MKAKNLPNLAVLITLIALIVAANTLTVLFILQRSNAQPQFIKSSSASNQAAPASHITQLLKEPQSIILCCGSKTISVKKGSEDYDTILFLNEKRKSTVRYCTELGRFETLSDNDDITLIYEYEKETPYILPLKYERPEVSLKQVYFILTGKNHECFAIKSPEGYLCYTGIGSNSDLIRICRNLLNNTAERTS